MLRFSSARATGKEKVYLLRLDHRRRRLSRPHRLGIFDLQHAERISQTVVRRSRHFRGTFSLIRSGEILIGAAAAPVVGTLMDRWGGRWLMAAGGLISGAGFICLGQARDFIQFMLVRWLLISPGDSLMGSMVVNVSISRWFVRMRGRALAIAGMGHGLAKVCMPVAAATLMLYVGWRGAWVVFGVFALLLVVAPAVLFMRRSRKKWDCCPTADRWSRKRKSQRQKSRHAKRTGADNVEWSRREALRTPVFWLIASTFGVAQIGVTGLNLHVFSYVTDQGHPTLVAASVMSIIAIMQFSTPIVWGTLADRMDNGILNMAKCALQGAGLLVALLLPGMAPLYVGFLSTASAWAARRSWRKPFGPIFRPHLAGKNPRHGLAGHQPLLSQRPAILRLALRLYGKLLPVL